jgi:predicted ATPase/class 3 adenylate cyclase
VPELPSGTVTFLFTDVEGSTKLLERFPASYRDAIASHHTILRDAVDGGGGFVFETVGDAVYAVFSLATGAVSAALRAQRALAAAPWGELGSLKVRMGLHTGEVELQGGHYFGASLYRCARLMSVAHGGQVVLSSVTADLVRAALPPGAELRDLGEHRLKDLGRTERIFQLSTAGLATEFPRLRTAGEAPNNLPAEPTPFIGREQEVDAALHLLQDSETRLLTLTGPGGIGKTRLSLQVGAAALARHADGVFFVELAPIPSAELVIPTIAKVLAVPETAHRPILDGVKEYLKDKDLLLVLDNFEHVVAAGGQLGDLLSACPRVKALVTSREALRIRRERQFLVPPLALPEHAPVQSFERLMRYEAVRLFVERARAVKSDFAVSERNAYAIAEICRRLDGLPLAIELAAARINIFSPQATLARLEHKLAVLTGGPRDAPARQQTLRQAIAWSYDLLSPTEQIVYRRLAVFAGGCTLAAAEAVVGGALDAAGLDVVAGMVSLVDKSLLRRGEGIEELRFSMLETIREYALERLTETEEADPLQARHAAYYLALAEEVEPALVGATQARWLDRLEEEADNLRAAVQWFVGAGPVDHGLRLTAALRRFWRARGYITEGRARMRELLSSTAGQERNTSRAKALHAAGWAAREQGDYGDARALIEESLGIYRELGDSRGTGWALVDLGFLTRYEGDYLVAASLLEESVVLLRQVNDIEGLAAALGNLGLIARDRGDADLAEARLTESLALWRTLGDRVGFGWALMALGIVARAQGRSDAARGQLEESLAVWQELNDRQNMANVLSTLARLACDDGLYDVARTHLRDSLSIFVEIGDRRGTAFVLEGFAGLAINEGQPARTICLEAAAVALRRNIGAPAPPAWRADLDRILELAGTALGPVPLADAAGRGRAMTLQEAVAFALEGRAAPVES